MNVKNLLNNWSLPDRTAERTQITLRLDYDLYARLHALKSVYPRRSVNDMINDIIKAGLDEIVASLPSYALSHDQAIEQGYTDDYGMPMTGVIVGKRVSFDSAYAELLEKNSTEETKEDEAA
jgi:hypothetical protein